MKTLTVPEFAKWANVSVHAVHKALRQKLLTSKEIEGVIHIPLNIFANTFAKAMKLGLNAKELPRWKGGRGVYVETFNKLRIYRTKGWYYVRTPEEASISFHTLDEARDYCANRTDVAKQNSRKLGTIRKSTIVRLTYREVQYLLSVVPKTSATTILHRKLSKAFQ